MIRARTAWAFATSVGAIVALICLIVPAPSWSAPALGSSGAHPALVGADRPSGGVLRAQETSQARELFRAASRQRSDVSSQQPSLESGLPTSVVRGRTAQARDTVIRRRALHREARRQSRSVPPA